MDRRFNNFGNWNNAPNQMGFSNQALPGQAGPMLNALQQQNLINALIAQNQQKNFGQGHQNNRFQNNRYPHGNNSNQNRHNNNNRDRRGGPAARPGDKRKNNNPSQGNSNKHGKKTFHNKNKAVSNTQQNKKKTPEEEKVDEIEIPDDQVIIPDSLMDSVEKLRMRTEIKRNVVDEDVEKLCVFSFTGRSYQCKTCGINVVKASSFIEHLMSKSHVMKVIDARTAKTYQPVRDLLDVDISSDDWFENSKGAREVLTQQAKVLMKIDLALKAKQEATYNKTPSNFFNFNMELRKSVVKKDEEVIITSLVESNVAVKDFTGEKFFGCEFVRAVTGFHCRLCSINIREAKGVIPHIESKLHKTNYNSYTRKNPEYEKTQKEQNLDLFEIMSQHDGKSVVLAESANVEESQFLSQLDEKLVRIPSVMKPETKEKEKSKDGKAEGEESEKTEDVDKSNDVPIPEVNGEKNESTEEPEKETECLETEVKDEEGSVEGESANDMGENDTEENYTEENDTEENDTEENNTEENNTEENNTEENDTEAIDVDDTAVDEPVVVEDEKKAEAPAKRGKGRSRAK